MKITHRDTGAVMYKSKKASMREALEEAVAKKAHLSGANLSGARAVHYQIPQEGELIVWKKLRGGICKLRIPPDAKRTGSIVGRKCRCEFAVVLELPKGTEIGHGTHDGTLYRKLQIVRADAYDPDPRVECSHGVHFFLSKEEAEDYA